MLTTHLPPFTTFGEMLRYLRQRARLTQRELAIACGYSESQISRLEKNDRLPEGTTILAVIVPALSLEDEPETVKRLLALAAAARGSMSPLDVNGHERAQAYGVEDENEGEGAPRSNLLPRLTSLVGREEALVSVRQLVMSQRLVTLTGVGGVGKSSLSQAVGSEVVREFADGVWLVELAALADAKLLPQSIAALFHLPEQAQRAPFEMLSTYFHHKRLLLVLDNCEHLIDACAQLANHLRHTCPDLHILATSRESLRVAGEVEWAVPPLEAPHEGGQWHAHGRALYDYSAVRLFVERGQAAKPDFEANEQSLPTIVHLCQQLDGLPLAIELAAARLKGMSVNDLATRLDDRFRLLASGARSAPARHQTLRAAIDWSYELLSAQERALLRRLTVFRGGWLLDAAEAITAMPSTLALPIPNVLDVLLQLVNKSLVVAESRGATTRYRLLETIRQYASEKLRESGDFEATCAQHFAFYLQLAEQWRDTSHSGRRFSEWLDRLDMEMENLRAAYAWSRKVSASTSVAQAGLNGALDDPADGPLDGETCALRLAGALWPFWLNRGHLAEGNRWMEESSARAPAAPLHLRATALVGRTSLAWYGTKIAEMIALGEEAVRLCQQVDDRLGLAHVYFALGEANRGMTDYGRANFYYAAAVEHFRAEKWLPGVGRALSCWSGSLIQEGRPAQALAVYEECLAVAQQAEGHFIVGGSLELLLALDHKRAKLVYQQELARRRGQVAAAPPGSRYEMEALAVLLQAYGRQVHYSGQVEDTEDGLAALEEALSLWQKLGIQWSMEGGTARSYFDLGTSHFLLGDYARAVAFEQEAIRLYTEVGDWHGVAWAYAMLGWPALAMHDLDVARSSFCAVLTMAADGNGNCLARALAGMAEMARLQGEIERAGRLYGAALRYELKDEPLSDLPAVNGIPTYQEDPRFDAGWAVGQAMTLAEAVGYALA